jgi:protein-tyrosine-phosphatase
MQDELMLDGSKPITALKRLLRNVVPERLTRERKTLLLLGAKGAPLYVHLRLMDIIGVRMASRSIQDARRFLFVCFGNLMRSAMAEMLFRAEASSIGLEDIAINSAGLHAVPGSSAHPWAITVSSEIGLSLADHRAQLVTRELVVEADVVFAMDFQNKADLIASYPQCRQKIVMLGSYGTPPASEIPDPYFGNIETTRRCRDTLHDCIRALITELAATRGISAK